MARLAVQVRCHQLDVGEPAVDSLRLVHRLERGEIIEFFLRNSELSARVVLPARSKRFGSSDVAVTLFAVEDLRIRSRRAAEERIEALAERTDR